MLTGDDLSIQLFIAGTAIAVMGIAVTQAGWTHKGFVWSLFVVALGLGFCALYWKQIREANPEVGAFASGIAGNSISWFTLLLLGFGAVFVLDLLARIGWFRTTATRDLPETPLRPSPTTSSKPHEEQIFVRATPQDLMAFYEGRTTLQGNQASKNYIGKWMYVTGKVNNTNIVSKTVLVSIRIMGEGKTIILLFDKEWEDGVSLLLAGQQIDAVGQIREMDHSSLTLEHCELRY